jgi:hypothetical protein
MIVVGLLGFYATYWIARLFGHRIDADEMPEQHGRDRAVQTSEPENAD